MERKLREDLEITFTNGRHISPDQKVKDTLKK